MAEPEPEDPWAESLPNIIQAARDALHDGGLESLRRELAAGASAFPTGGATSVTPMTIHTGSLFYIVCGRSVAQKKSPFCYEPGESPAEERIRVAIIEEILAAGLPPNLVCSNTDWTITRYASYYNRPLILAVLIEAAGPDAAAMVRHQPRSEWTALQTASRAGHTECVRLLLSAGAGSDINDRNPLYLTALGCAIQYSRRHIYPMLLAAGATFPPFDAARLSEHLNAHIYGTDVQIVADALTQDSYLRKVAAVGFPAYEKAHRQTLVALAAKAFPRLPTDVAAQVVAFAFHVGYY